MNNKLKINIICSIFEQQNNRTMKKNKKISKAEELEIIRTALKIAIAEHSIKGTTLREATELGMEIIINQLYEQQ